MGEREHEVALCLGSKHLLHRCRVCACLGHLFPVPFSHWPLLKASHNFTLVRLVLYKPVFGSTL